MATRSKTAPEPTARKVARKTPVRAARPSPASPSKSTGAAPQPAAAPTASDLPQTVKRPKAIKPVKASAVAKAQDKPKKPKLVRDSFTIPKAEYEAIAALKLRAAKLGQTPKKSELLRAGLQALVTMGDAALLAALAAVPSIKTGRPAA